MPNLWNVFAAHAEADPAAPALIFADATISFGQLIARARQCAAALATCDVRRGTVVALQLTKLPLTYSLLLACLRLGAPYVFVDPKNPPDRTARVLARVRPKILFTESGTPNPYGQVFSFAAWAGAEGAATSSVVDRLPDATGMDPAYIMFTSGSTGEPKGAVIPHQGVLSLMAWARRALVAGSSERFTNINPLHFDNSVFDIYCGLGNGAAVVPIETAELTNPASWVRIARATEATVMFAVPTLFLVLDQLGLLTPVNLPTIRTFIFGGEGYPIGKLREFHGRFEGRARLLNVYGPTETSCICSSTDIGQDHLRTPNNSFPPLGRMHDDFSYALLDDEQRTVARGAVGELWIGGPCVGLGYYANDKETAARFCQDPRQDHYRSIYYRSGDLVREDSDGCLWFQGRVDNQVKFRGYRIELEEIDLVVQSLPSVRRAITVLLEGPDGNELAVALTADRAIATDYIDAACRQTLPVYMRPSRFFQLDDLPQNANGKIDRSKTRALLEKML